FTVSEVVASTVFTPPGRVSSDVSVPLSVTLPPGDYALIFGSGLFGSTSTRGGIMISNGVDTPAGVGSYIFWIGSISTWRDGGGSNLRFTINGNILEDTTPPIITVPADITLEAPADTTPANTGTATATDDVDPTPIVTFSDVSVSGTGQTIETITRTWTATDDSSNSVSADQIITVQDTTDPVLTVPADITVQTTNLYSVPVTYTITVTDTFDANPTLVCTPASGDLFAVDTTTLVTCDATDASGNTSTDFFNVTVEKIAGPPSDPGPPPDAGPPDNSNAPPDAGPPSDPGPPAGKGKP
ncbi:MAG: HYR domain-containing protein, partial [Thaumarchaeota archaeon]|nr:HYR domain-containing protein [Nitrososphaerota archaeon]